MENRSALASLLSLALLSFACAHSERAPSPVSVRPTSEASPAPVEKPATAPLPQSSPPTPVLPVTVAAVGDIMMGSTFPDETGGMLPPDDGRLLFAEVEPLLQSADVAFGNLEGPLVDGGTSEKCAHARPGHCYAFRTPTRYAERLKDAGFRVVSVANNHASDFGEEGRSSTWAALDGVGILHAGAPNERVSLVVRGTKIAVVAFSTSAGTKDLRDLDEAARIVREAAQNADIVIVSFHGGGEGADRQHVVMGHEDFLGEDRGDLRAFARTVVDAGASLVIGSGPHVVRGMEVLHGRLVAYSLGNFATYGGMNLKGPNGLSLVLELRLALDGSFLEGHIHPVRQEKPGGPKLDPAGEIIPLVRDLSRADFGEDAVTVKDDGTILPPTPRLTALPAMSN